MICIWSLRCIGSSVGTGENSFKQKNITINTQHIVKKMCCFFDTRNVNIYNAIYL